MVGGEEGKTAHHKGARGKRLAIQKVLAIERGVEMAKEGQIKISGCDDVVKQMRKYGKKRYSRALAMEMIQIGEYLAKYTTFGQEVNTAVIANLLDWSPPVEDLLSFPMWVRYLVVYEYLPRHPEILERFAQVAKQNAENCIFAVQLTKVATKNPRYATALVVNFIAELIALAPKKNAGEMRRGISHLGLLGMKNPPLLRACKHAMRVIESKSSVQEVRDAARAMRWALEEI